jgi:hypothetical protein
MLLRRLLAFGAVIACGGAPARMAAQRAPIQVNAFGHLEYSAMQRDSLNGYFSLGEHSLFATGSLSDRVSFLGEAVLRPVSGSSTGFGAALERALLRIGLRNNHALIVGKVHTPVNYWNDVYHHGRLFYPVIDRPFAFSHLVPLHTLGVQMQGQNLGRARFGYDLMMGNGIASTDTYQGGKSPALMAAVHAKPIDGMRVGVSIYRDWMPANGYGAHSGHAGHRMAAGSKLYTGPLEFQLGSASFAWFTSRFEILSELSINRNRTDSLGTATNRSSFVYAGARVRDGLVAYAFGDRINAATNDLHVYPLQEWKVGSGVRYDLATTVHVKAQVEYQRERMSHAMMGHSGSFADPFMPWTRAFGLRVQLAYGL